MRGWGAYERVEGMRGLGVELLGILPCFSAHNLALLSLTAFTYNASSELPLMDALGPQGSRSCSSPTPQPGQCGFRVRPRLRAGEGGRKETRKQG